VVLVKGLWKKFVCILGLFVDNSQDARFLRMIRYVENFTSKVLAIALVFIIFIALIDLMRTLTLDIFFIEPRWTFSAPLLKIFGMFLNVLIALELMENITAYLRNHTIQLELVIVTALTAVARKIVIYDTKSEGDIAGLAIAVLALAISYWIIRQNRTSSN